MDTLLLIPHGHCYLWKSNLVGLHLVSDALISLAYYSIPLTLVYFVRQRQDVPFKEIFLLFGAFIISCGTTHLMAVWTLWHPDYWVSGTVKAVTAFASVYTAIALVPIVPQALNLPSPAQLEAINHQLQQEIADRTQAEILLRESERRYITLLAAAPVGIARTDVTGDCTYVNNCYCQITGLTLEAALGRGWRQGLHPSDRDRVIDEWARCRQEGVLFQAEYRFQRPDGTVAWVYGRAVPEWDAGGQLVAYVGTITDISDRKETEVQLIKSEAHLRTAQRIAQLGSWEFDARTNEVQWSEEVFRMFDRDPELGAPSFEELQQLLHPHDRDHHAQVVQTAIASAQPYEIEFRAHRPDGTSIYIQGRGEPIVDATGQVIQLLGTVLDISDRKLAEAQLQSLSDRLTLALQAGAIGTWEWDLVNDPIWDAQMYEIYGLHHLSHSFTYQDWVDRVNPEDLEVTVAKLQAAIRREQDFHAEFRIWRTDGMLRWIEAAAIIQWDAGGQPLRMTGINWDITDRKLAEAQLQDLTNRLTLALESGAIGTWQWDLVSDGAAWDDRMYEIYGLQHLGRPAVYQDWVDRVHPDDFAATEAAFFGAIQGEGTFDVEFRIWRTDGELRWIKANALVPRDAKGQPLSITGINMDITHRKRAEEKLAQTAAQLAASNRELEAFAYSVSHDLRAPLRAIDGFSQALLEDYGDTFDEDAKDYFDRIRSNVARMSALIDDLLSLSRVSRSEIRYTTVNLSTLAQEIVEELQTSNPERCIEVAIAPDVVVTADAALMRVALTNLLDNAWKFTSRHPTARIEFGVMYREGQPVYFVRDDGAGFDMAYSNMLFGVFQRLHGVREFPGTGIGLASAQRVIHRHGGEVWAEGAVEQGATFYFTLPSRDF